jgi:hypothetical protein
MTPGHAAIYGQVMAVLGNPAAGDVRHPGGDLGAHLQATYALLTRWQAPERVCLAGLTHALYGTLGFEQALAPLSARPDIAAVLGE